MVLRHLTGTRHMHPGCLGRGTGRSRPSLDDQGYGRARQMQGHHTTAGPSARRRGRSQLHHVGARTGAVSGPITRRTTECVMCCYIKASEIAQREIKPGCMHSAAVREPPQGSTEACPESIQNSPKNRPEIHMRVARAEEPRDAKLPRYIEQQDVRRPGGAAASGAAQD